MTTTTRAELVGYKEIGRHLGVSERTARRLARDGMPLKRERGKRRGSVRVPVADLEKWWEKRF